MLTVSIITTEGKSRPLDIVSLKVFIFLLAICLFIQVLQRLDSFSLVLETKIGRVLGTSLRLEPPKRFQQKTTFPYQVLTAQHQEYSIEK